MTKSIQCPNCNSPLTFVYSQHFAPYALCSCGKSYILLYNPQSKTKDILEFAHTINKDTSQWPAY